KHVVEAAAVIARSAGDEAIQPSVLVSRLWNLRGACHRAAPCADPLARHDAASGWGLSPMPAEIGDHQSIAIEWIKRIAPVTQRLEPHRARVHHQQSPDQPLAEADDL